jgi:arabinose-5-phosphate isomerase
VSQGTGPGEALGAAGIGSTLLDRVQRAARNLGLLLARAGRARFGSSAVVVTDGEAGTGAVAEVFELFDVGLAELARLRARLEAPALEAGLALLRAARAAGGRVHVTGIGKCEHVARYAAALLASTGTPATFLHATEAVHGSAGQVVPGDAVVAVSNSGETLEMRAALRAVRRMGARVLVVTGKRHSWLARHADAVIEAGVAREGGPLGLAPRVSIAAEILVLAGLAAALERESGLTLSEYHARHPAGRLGERSRED